MKSPIARNEDIIWRRVEDGVVLIGSDGLVIHVLNKTAARIWELCDGTKGPDEIITDLCEHFDVTPDEVSADVQDTLDRFEGLGLLKKKGRGVKFG
jgi:hypothetical protein